MHAPWLANITSCAQTQATQVGVDRLGVVYFNVLHAYAWFSGYFVANFGSTLTQKSQIE